MKSELTFIDKILKNRILSHIIFWLIILVVQSQVFFFTGREFKESLLMLLAIFPSMLLAGYTLVYFQLPKLAFRKKYLLFILSLGLSAYLFTALGRIITIFVVEPYIGLDPPDPDYFWILLGQVNRLIKGYLLSVYLGAVIMAIVKLIKLRSEEKIRIEQLEKEKTTSELNFLKAQIHPHFLLNTLNNLYALTLKKSDEAPETVLKLSEMLSYVLYKCNEPLVKLSDEIKLIDNYIALERLRYGTSLNLKFGYSVSDKQQNIAPLILLSIVENAFKHGVSGDVNEPKVIITLKTKNNMLHFTVFNTKNTNKQADPNNYTKGIGSKNVKKQLDLLYKDTYSLDIQEENETYTVNLTLPLNE